MEGLEIFQKLILNSGKKDILDKIDPTDPKLGEVVMNSLFKSEVPTKINRSLSEDEKVFVKIFDGFIWFKLQYIIGNRYASIRLQRNY